MKRINKQKMSVWKRELLTLNSSLLTLLATVLLVGCQKEQTETAIDHSKIVNISASIGERSIFNTRTAPLGATVEDRTSFYGGDKIAVSNGSQGNNWMTYTYDGTMWDVLKQYDEGKFLTWDTEQMNFNAYYPAIDGVSITEFTLPTDQRDDTNIALADWMTVENLQISQSSAAALNFQRKTARVNVKIDGFGLPYTEMPAISNFRIYSGKESATGTTPIAITPHYDEASNTYTALVLPTDAKDTETFITLTANDSKEETVLGIPTLQAGETYTYNLAVGKGAKIGDYYFKDGTWSSNKLDETAENPIIGVVFWVDVNRAHGKVVSLDEENYLAWSTEYVDITGAENENNGLANMQAVWEQSKDYTTSNSFDKYPAFAWVHQKNINAGIAHNNYVDAKGVWYLPSKGELQILYAGFTYDNSTPAPNSNTKKAVNNALTALGADATLLFDRRYYRSSTESGSNDAWEVYFTNGYTSFDFKGYAGDFSRTRAVLAF